MLRKIASTLLALTGLAIGLGAFGHSFMGRKALDAGLASLPIDAHTDKLIHLVWYFCGGCMLVFGALVIRGARMAMRGERGALFAPCTIGVFYLATGIIALAYIHQPFWSVFAVLGGLTLVLSALLGFASAGSRAVSPIDQAAA
jgi:hypothetical protein